jgi:hypothetical protein
MPEKTTEQLAYEDRIARRKQRIENDGLLSDESKAKFIAILGKAIGYYGLPKKIAVQRMAMDFGVSQRTAYRHISEDCLPDPWRSGNLQRTGRTYPRHRPQDKRGGAYDGDLQMARAAIRRLARKETFHPDDMFHDDIDFLEGTIREATELLKVWRQRK